MIKENLTVVIPSKNEEAYIEKTLESLSKQVGITGTRVIIADGNSTDKTLSIIEKFKKKHTLKIEVIKGGSVSVGRNRGAALATTKNILFLDSDTEIFESTTILDCMRLMKEADLVTCKVKCTVKDFRASMLYSIFNIIQPRMKESFSTGMFMMINRKVFNLCKGFDETVHQSEDYLLSRKIDKRDFRISHNYVGQDNRRFKKTGYFGMLKTVAINWINRKNEDHFRKDIQYW